MDLFTSFDGRISRKSFWLGTLGITVIVIVCVLVLRMFFSGSLNITSMILSLVFIYPAAAISIKRLHDRNKPAMPWIAFFFLPGLISKLMQLFHINYSVLDISDIGEMGAMVMMIAVVDGQDMLVPGKLAMLVSFASLIVGTWMLVELGILKGTDGENDYGPDPRI